jgi:hypothetical protein
MLDAVSAGAPSSGDGGTGLRAGTGNAVRRRGTEAGGGGGGRRTAAMVRSGGGGRISAQEASIPIPTLISAG